jgi:hypothetical protein
MQIVSVDVVSISVIGVVWVGIRLEATIDDYHRSVGVDLVVALVSCWSVRGSF